MTVNKKDTIGTVIRLCIEIVALVWAVAGLNNATTNLREIVTEIRVDERAQAEWMKHLQENVTILCSSTKSPCR